MCRHASAWSTAEYPLAHQRRSGSDRLGGQYWSLQRWCHAGGQMDRKRLLYPGHCSVTAFSQPRHIDIVIRGWISGSRMVSKKGRLRHGGSGLVCRKHSSSLLFCSSAGFSAGQSMFNLATTWLTTSNGSTYCVDWGGESSKRGQHHEERWWRLPPQRVCICTCFWHAGAFILLNACVTWQTTINQTHRT